ncbi:type IV pilus secretin PilQ [Polynucleobacter necessarius]|uniref:type IV pilus secretin PilQ n=1 Tax=Polynucleobacter necessarius TaxID=576610 RepID=UPI000E09CBE3|nr:type IV pilus secretin PilQ [Polynucleobacter necessarius]
MVLDPQQIMNDLAPKTQKTLDIGPKIDKKPNAELDAQRRHFINESQRTEDGRWKSFNVTLNFVDVDIRELAQAMTQVSGVNILVGDEVEGTVTVKITNVPWDKALDNILRIKGLSKSVDSEAGIIRIQKPETVLARDEFERKRLEEVSKQLAAKRIISTQYTEIFRLYYTKPARVKAQLEAIFGGTGAGGAAATRPSGGIIEITTDERINSVIIKGTKSEMELAAKLISKLDIRTQEVLIEAFVVEASDNWQKELGVRLGAYSNINSGPTSIGGVGVAGPNNAASNLALGTPAGSVFNQPVNSLANPFGLGYLYQTSASALKVELTALEQLDVMKVISNPHVFTMDNEEAVVIDGVQIPYPVPGVGTNQITYEFKDAALKLTVTPSVVGDGNLYLNMIVNKDSPNYTTQPPSINKREVRSKLLLKDGTIAVIGGIYDQTQENKTIKVPLLGDIPYLGYLFRYNYKQDNKTQLLVFIAPKVLN